MKKGEKKKKKWLQILIPLIILAVIVFALKYAFDYLAANSMLVMADVMVYVKLCGPWLIPALVLAVVLLVIGIAFRKKITGRKRFMYEAQSIIAVIAALIIGVNGIVLNPMQYLLNLFLADNNGIKQTTLDGAADLAMQVAEEGTVLLKNENGYLPLDSSATKLNVFGWASTCPAYGGGGSGQIAAGADCVTLLQGLENAGFETNKELTDFYTSYASERPEKLPGTPENLVEPYAKEYSKKLLNDARKFSDTAMVVITRSGQETADQPTEMGNVTANATAASDSSAGKHVEYKYFEDDQHYLELSTPEREMVDLVCSNFSNVIVLYNGSNAFELGWTEQYDNIRSVLMMSAPGEKGFQALGGILSGEINPSGRLTDTYVYDMTKIPTFNNFGNYQYDNADGFSFVNYVEGIYEGYKFYETADAEGMLNYKDAVQYPFGHGLSYTTFSEKITKYSATNDLISMDVSVTNTGDTAGKDVLELYYTPPYYNGGIEKSAVELLNFEKTEELKPGENTTVHFEFKPEDMASYDEGIKVSGGGYILEAGEYELSVRADAHTVLDSRSYDVDKDIIYTDNEDGARSTDLTAAVNQFKNTSEGDVEYLSRKDHFANYETATAAPKSYNISNTYAAKLVDNNTYKMKVNDDDTMPVTGKNNGLKLKDMVGLSYDDPKWDKLLDQLTTDEMADLISIGGWQTVRLDSIDKPATLEADGPAGFSSFFSAAITGTAFPSEVMVGSTWNREICRKIGEYMAKEGADIGVSGWYAPAVNLHRSPFGGRNFEYFSEDGVLSGRLAAEIVEGAEKNGLYCFTKHFALNDQETNRIGKLCTWATEQSIRETYLKPFEYVVKDGGATAMMSSYSYIGTEWCGSNKPLLTSVLRDEWGFRGTVITDYFGGYGYMDADRAIRAGNDLMLTNSGTGDAELEDTDSATAVIAMRNSAHNILYTVANSNAMDQNAQHQTWVSKVIMADVIAAAVLMAAEVIIILIYRKKKQA